MVKAAYQKLLWNKIWLSLAVTLLAGFFLCGYVSSMDVCAETVEMVVWFSVIIGGLTVLLVIYQMIWGIVQIQRLKSCLNGLSVFTRERLEHDFQTGDQIGDLHFTGSHLFVLQIRPGSRQGIACIPYEEILAVRVRPNMQTNTFLEILRTQEQPSHYVFESLGVRAETIAKINDKIAGLRAHMDQPRPMPEEQKKAEERKRKATGFEKIWDTGIFHMALAFGMMMLFCYSIVLAERGWDQVSFAQKWNLAEYSPKEMGSLMFWPNLLFYLVMYGGSLLLFLCIFLFMRRRLGRKEGETVEWRSRWRAAVFTAMVILFMIFVGSIYSSDVGSWAKLTQGWYLMTGSD